MVILKLNCQKCHKHFKVDNDKIKWKFNGNWFSCVACPRCGYANYIDWIEQFR